MRSICLLVLIFGVLFFFGNCKPAGKPDGNSKQTEDAKFTVQEAKIEKEIEFWSVKAPKGSFVRDPFFAAGGWYPAPPEGLLRSVRKYITEAQVEKIEDDIVGILAPHAGYVYSGAVAGCAYKPLLGKSYDVVVILSANHTGAPTSVGRFDFFRMPFGDVPVVERGDLALFVKEAGISDDPAAHIEEHAIELQLPFLCATLKEFRILPIVVGHWIREEKEKCDRLVNALANFVKGKKFLIVVSSDLSHRPPYELASAADREFLEALKTLDVDKLLEADKTILSDEWAQKHGVKREEIEFSCTACGLDALVVALKLFNKLGVSGYKLLKYANSHDTANGDRKEVVGYAAAVFFRPEKPR
ncbi:MAG: AmmeMemoRadiSam system protein B [Planctomycetota bacterium]|nr:AmmeMemoRadiSam system protein B [Planctomycetota bacterium]